MNGQIPAKDTLGAWDPTPPPRCMHTHACPHARAHTHTHTDLQPGEWSVGRVVDTGQPPDYDEGRTAPLRQEGTGYDYHRPPRAPVLPHPHGHEPAGEC